MCFSLDWIEQILIWVILAVVVIGILKIIVAAILPKLGEWGSMLAQVIDWVIWGIIAIVVVVFSIELIKCLLTYAPHIR
jgi:hypothetical protein